MPQRTTRSRPRRSAPYDLRDRATMATTIASSMPSWPPPPYHHATVSWPDHHLHYAHQQLPPSYLPALSASIPQASLPAIIGHPSQSQPSQSAPWTTDEDQLLLDAKSQGYAWNEIHTKYFPNKSGNACRKRHERLVQKLRTTDWSEQRIQRVIQCYNEDRERLWKPLSDRLGEHWQDLERVVSDSQPRVKWSRTNECNSVFNKDFVALRYRKQNIHGLDLAQVLDMLVLRTLNMSHLMMNMMIVASA